MSYSITQFKVNEKSAQLCGQDINIKDFQDSQEPASCKSVNNAINDIKYYEPIFSRIYNTTGQYIYSTAQDFTTEHRIKIILSEPTKFAFHVILTENQYQMGTNYEEIGLFSAGETYIDIPNVISDKKYIGVCVSSNQTGTVKIDISRTIKQEIQELQDLNDYVQDINISLYGEEQEEFTLKPGYTNSDGSWINVPGDNNYATTTDIPVKPNDELIITLTLNQSNSLMTWVTCKDINNNPVTDVWKYLHTTYKGLSDTTVYIVPENIYYVVFTFWRHNNGFTFTVMNNSLDKGIIYKLDSYETDIKYLKQNINYNINTITSSVRNIGSKYIKDDIASYWFDEVNVDDYENYGTYLDEKINSVPDGKHFIYITDCHYQGDISNADNTKQSAAIIDYVRRRLNIKTIIHGGDVMQERSDSLTAAKDWIAFNDDFVGRFGSDFKQVCGDHDHNAKSGSNSEDDVFSFQFVQKMITGYNKDNLVFDHIYDDVIETLNWSDEIKKEYYAYNKIHYYFDDITANTRFIILFTGWTKNNI